MIRQMVKNVIKAICLLAIITLPIQVVAQDSSQLTKEQYKVIEGAFKNSGKEYTRIFFQTIDYKSWVHLLSSAEKRQPEGVGLCTFTNSNLEAAMHELIYQVIGIQVKKLNQTKLGKRFVLVQDLTEAPYLSITEPMIVGEYAFILFKYANSESLSVLKKNSEENWVYECSIPLFVVFID